MKKQRRGGRKPGAWRQGLTASALRQFRENNHVSRIMLARAIGVSATTIQNWETGASIPIPRSQDDLERIMANPALVVRASRDGHTNDGAHGVLIATGTIVAACLTSDKCITVDSLDGLVETIHAVRGALESKGK